MNFGFLLRDSFSDCVFGGGGWGVLVCFIIKILYFKRREDIWKNKKKKKKEKEKKKKGKRKKKETKSEKDVY